MGMWAGSTASGLASARRARETRAGDAETALRSSPLRNRLLILSKKSGALNGVCERGSRRKKPGRCVGSLYVGYASMAPVARRP